MAKVVALKATKPDYDTVPAGDVREHIGRALTMLEEVENRLAPGDERSLTIAEGLLAGAIGELRSFSEHLC